VKGAFDTNLNAWKGGTVTLRIAVFTDNRDDTFSSLFIDDLSFSKTAPGAETVLPVIPYGPSFGQGLQFLDEPQPPPTRPRASVDSLPDITPLIDTKVLERSDGPIPAPRTIFTQPLQPEVLRRILAIPTDWYHR
jgi:hypothetical protein